MPAVLKDRVSPARSNKPRAQDMDESLMLTERMREHVELLINREKEAVGKMKDNKGAVQKLRDQINIMQTQLEAAQSDKEAAARATADLKTQIDKLENEHAVLNATHTWTKSSLDSALAAQEEYRKGYNSLRAAYKKAKEDLDKLNEELASSAAAKEDLQKAKALEDERKACWKQELDAVNATMRRMACQHKDKSKSVLGRMMLDQTSALLSACFSEWVHIVQDWRQSEKAKAEVSAVQSKLSKLQKQKNEEAKSFFTRVLHASDAGLVSQAYRAWVDHCADVAKEKREADKLAGLLKKQKSEARRKLEAALGENMKGVQVMSFRAWAHFVKEEKEEQRVKAEAEALMREFKRRKNLQSLQIVDRMASKKDKGALEHMFLLWKIVVGCLKAVRVQEEETKARMAALVKEIERARGALGEREEELEDRQEELKEVQRKNKVMRGQLAQITDLQDRMEEVQRELEEDD